MSETVVELRNLHFSYHPQQPLLTGATLSLGAGERIGIQGANGSGKSTLLQMIVGLLPPTAGEIRIFGRSCCREADFEAIRPLVGLLFQDPDDQLFCPTVLEDVAFGPLNQGHPPAAARRIAEETLEQMGLSGFGNRVISRLSGGEKRLVSLAAVLAMSPRVLLLDEPLTALDETARERVISMLEKCPQAMIAVSHDQAFMRRFSARRLSLTHGKLTPSR